MNFTDGDQCPACGGCILLTETDDGVDLVCDDCGEVFTLGVGKKSYSAPLACLVRQQEYALSQASYLRQMASEYRQMGFKEISHFCNEQAVKAERWALKIVAV